MSNRDDLPPDPPPPDDPFDDELEPGAGPLPASGPGSLAPVWSRGIARAVDLFIGFSAGYWLAQLAGLIEIDDNELIAENPLAASLFVLLVWGVYEVAGTLGGGRTVGKLLMGIRVRQAGADAAPRPLKALTRWLVPGIVLLLPLGQFVILALMLVYFSAVLNDRQQGLHDRAADTLVVRAR